MARLWYQDLALSPSPTFVGFPARGLPTCSFLPKLITAFAATLQNCHQAKIGLDLRTTPYVSYVSLPRHMSMSQLSGPCPHASLSYSRSQAPRVSKALSCPQRLTVVAAVAKEPAQQTIRIKLKAYELPLLKQSVQEIITTANSNGMTLSSATSCHHFQASPHAYMSCACSSSSNMCHKC